MKIVKKSFAYSLLLVLVIICFVFINSKCFAKSYTYMYSQDEKFIEYVNKAMQLRSDNKTKEGIELLKKAYDINPEQMQVIGLLCGFYLEIEDAEKIIEYANKGLEVARRKLSKDNIGRFYHYLGGAYKLIGKDDLAIKYLTLALVNKPYFTDDYPSLAYSYYQIKNYDKAIEFYEKADNKEMIVEVREARSKSSPLAKHIDLALGNMLKNNDEAAENEYHEILKLDSDNVVGLIGMAGAERKKENYEKAASFGEKAIEQLDKEENSKYRFFYPYLYCNILNNSYEKLENYDKSTNYIKLYLIATHTADASNAIDSGDYETALTCYKKALEKEIETEFVHYNYMAMDGYIDLLLLLKKMDEAKIYIQKAIDICKKEKNNDKIAHYAFQSGRYYVLMNEYEKAVKYCNVAYDKEKNINKKLKYKFLAANACACLNDEERTMKEFDICRKLIDEGAEDIYDVESKIVYYKSVFDKNSDLNKFNQHSELCKKYFLEGNNEKALDEAVISLKYRPQNIEILSLLECILFKMGKEEEGFEVLMEGINTSKRDHDFSCYDMLCYDAGNYYARKDDYEKALPYYILANKYKPSDKDYLYNIGYTYKMLKQYDKAIVAFSQGLKLDPNDVSMARHLEDCRKKLKE